MEWVSFTGDILSEQKNLLQWQTSQEINTAYFELEYGLDQHHFIPVAKHKAAGNTSTLKQYSLVHTHQETDQSTYYYRVKQVDMDGSFCYSKTIALTNEKLAQPNTTISVVNPVIGSVKFDLNQTEAAEITVRIIDNAGSLLMSKKLDTAAGYTKHELLETSLLPAGLYYIEIQENGKQLTIQKLVKSGN